MENVTKVGPIQSVVARIKVIARNALRGQLIAARLSRIATINAVIADVNADTKKLNERIAQAKYDISKIDSANPSAARLTKVLEENIKLYEADIVDTTKHLESLNKDIAEQNKGIAAIESGETKVDAEELNALTDKLINSSAKALAEAVKPVTTA